MAEDLTIPMIPAVPGGGGGHGPGITGAVPSIVSVDGVAVPQPPATIFPQTFVFSEPGWRFAVVGGSDAALDAGDTVDVTITYPDATQKTFTTTISGNSTRQWTIEVATYQTGSHSLQAHIKTNPSGICGFKVAFTNASPVFAIVKPAGGGSCVGGNTFAVEATTTDKCGDRMITATIATTSTIAGASTHLARQQTNATDYQGSLPMSNVNYGPIVVRFTCYDSGDSSNTTSHSVTINATDAINPTIQILSPESNAPFTASTSANGTRTATVTVSGVAADAQSGVASVHASTSSAANASTITATVTGTKNATWSAALPVTGLGSHTVYAWATDAVGNRSATVQCDFQVIDGSAPPTNLDDRLSKREYLAALQAFTNEQIVIPGAAGTTAASPGTAAVSQVLGQPVDRLLSTDDPVATVVLSDVNELRVPIEILRGYIAQMHYGSGPGASAEAAYRAAAYAGLLSGFGTSLAEVQQARGAATATRTELAARLGITLSTSRPDELDQLLLDGTTLTETNLETYFGLADTTGIMLPATPVAGRDPLLVPATGLLLGWQQAALAADWAVADAGPLSSSFSAIVDPDVIGGGDLTAAGVHTAIPGLIQARAAQLSTYAATLQSARTGAVVPAGGSSAAAGVTAMVAVAMPGFNLATIATQEAAGIDITATLGGVQLNLSGYRYLSQLGTLAAGVTPTDGEWSTAVDILVSAYKRTLYPAWRAAEVAGAIAISPANFQVTSSAPPAGPYRVDPSARTDWQAVLVSRTAALAGLTTAAASVVANVEQSYLSLLRDALLSDVAAGLLPIAGGPAATVPASHDLPAGRPSSPATPTPLPPAAAGVVQGRASVPLPPAGTKLTAGVSIADILHLVVPHLTLMPSIQAIADTLTTQFQVDFNASGNLRTTRMDQAIESLQALLFAFRAGELPASSSAHTWTFASTTTAKDFDDAWQWMGTYVGWQSATTVFLFPEPHLDPALYPSAARFSPVASTQYDALCDSVAISGLTPAQANTLVGTYLTDAAIAPSTVDFTKTMALTWYQGGISLSAMESGWAVPMLVAQRLQAGGYYLDALDWYRVVYPYDRSGAQPSYTEIAQEISAVPAAPNLTQGQGWTTLLNPFDLVSVSGKPRPAPYLRATLLSIAGCMVAYADSLFTQEAEESVALARDLYLEARQILQHPRLTPVAPSNAGEATLAIPDLAALLLKVESQLAKVRQGRNIAGMPRLQGAPTGALIAQPTPYRYKVLLARAQQLATQAAQIEAEFLSALEKYDAQQLQVIDARNAVNVAQAQVVAADARVTEASDAVTVAQAQQTKATAMVSAYQQQIDAGPNQYQQNLLSNYSDMRTANDAINASDAAYQIAQAIGSAASVTDEIDSLGAAAASASVEVGAIGVKLGLQEWLNNLQYKAQVNQVMAGVADQQTQWRLQQASSAQDALVAATQVTSALDGVTVAQYDSAVASVTQQGAITKLTFLTTQFTNADLYNWMSQVLGGVYRDFLQQATAVARLAQQQLAFERAQAQQSFIRSDYTQAPQELLTSSSPDRKAMTGAESLADDLAQLDNYAFSSDRRSLNLSQTISLAQYAPDAFITFRSTGVLAFSTPAGLFDNDFPGHYLRLVKGVRVSLVALVPPSRGIRASLYSTGISRTVAPLTSGATATPGFTTVTLCQDPGVISFTSPASASGVFDLDPQPDMMRPFEGGGVDTSWTLVMPVQANPFDYASIADVLVTIDYTAYFDAGYRSMMIRALNANLTRTAECVFSLAQDFPDQWYALNNPDPASTSTDRSVTVTLSTNDFPSGLTGLTTGSVAVQLVGAEAAANPILLTLQRGATSADAQTLGGLAATTRGSAPAWNAFVGGVSSGPADPTGDWTLTLHADGTAMLADGGISDILLVVGWSGSGAPWQV